MREKVLQWLDLTGGTFDKEVKNCAEQYRRGFQRFLGEELPAAETEAIGVFENALRSRESEVVDKIVEAHAKFLSEEDLDALIAFYSSPTGKKVTEFGAKLQEEINRATVDWISASQKDVEADWRRLLGDPAAQPAERQAAELPREIASP